MDYYRGLIAIRKQQVEIRNCTAGFRQFIQGPTDLVYGLFMPGRQTVLVYVNADARQQAEVKLPAGTWTVLADAATAGPAGHDERHTTAVIPPLSGLILVK